MKNVRISNFYVFFMIKSIHFFCMSEPPDLPAVLLNCGHETTSSANYRWHGQHRREVTDKPIAIWQYTVSGQGAIRVGDQVHTLETGKAFLVTVPDKHIYYLPESSSHWEFLYLTGSGFALIELTYAMQQKFGKILQHSAQSPTVRKTLEIIREYQEKPLPDFCTASAMAYDIWMVLYQELNSNSTQDASPLLTAASDYLRRNLLKTPCDVTELAAALGYSRAHFTRKFTAECGMPPGKFLLDWRLRMAARILSTEHSQIKSAAWRTGFSDVSHFCRVFKQKYGVSPKSFCIGHEE